MSNLIKIASWNVNGIRGALKRGFLDWMASHGPDILCVQETKAVEDQLPRELLEIPGYVTHWHSALRKGYSGVGIFTKVKPETAKGGLGIERFDAEGRFLQLDFPDFTLMNIYFPNGKASSERLEFKMEFYDAFLDYVEGVRKRQNRIIFVGDVNTAHNEIDLARPKENSKVSGFLPVERAWMDKVVDCGYVDTFRHLHPDSVEYSWWDMKSRARERNVGWRIDYIFVTRETLPSVKGAFILTDVMGSDHCPVGIDLESRA